MEQIKTINQPNEIVFKIDFFETLLSAWKLTKNGYLYRNRGYRIKQQIRCVYYSIRYPKFSSSWIAFLTSEGFKFVFLNRPRLYIKPFLPYISTNWNELQKRKVITDTYRFVKKNKNLNLKLLTDSNGLQIGDYVCNNEYGIFFKLGYEERFRKEGEFVLSLECKQLGGKIFSATISFEEIKDDHWKCIIGCVQGYKENTHEAVKKIQKLMHGMRPSALLVFVIQELCQILNANSICGISDKCQIFRKKHGVYISPFHRISFDYDQFWKEVDGRKIDDQWFELPKKTIHKEYANIQSHKRAMYRKRYQMLDEISEQISSNSIFN